MQPLASGRSAQEQLGAQKLNRESSDILNRFTRKFVRPLYSLRKMARETGLEPAASAVTGRRSNQLSYSRGRCDLGSIRIADELKAPPALVKVVANPPCLTAFFAKPMQKWAVFGQRCVGHLDGESSKA
jgi:hypothetical protein